MKIAFVYDAVYPWIKGGAEKRIYELGKRLVRRGHQVHVFGVKWWSGAAAIEHEGMVLHGVCSPVELYVNGRRSISEALIFSVKLFQHLIKDRFDVIDVSAFPYFPCFTVKLVSALRRNPMVITWHEVWRNYWYEYLGLSGFFGKIVEHLVSKLTSSHIAVSDMTGNNLKLLGVRGDSIHILPNGIDLKSISDIQPSSEACDVIFAGRLIREKNVDVLLEAIDYIRASLPDIKCYIIGDGPEKDRLEALAARCGLAGNVRFSGFMDYDAVISQIKSSKVMVLPSSREGFGMVVIEAFACGVPAVTVKDEKNAASLLVSEETGFVVKLDAREIGDAIRTLVMDANLRRSMGRSAEHTAEQYDWDRIAEHLVHIYEELTEQK